MRSAWCTSQPAPGSANDAQRSESLHRLPPAESPASRQTGLRALLAAQLGEQPNAGDLDFRGCVSPDNTDEAPYVAVADSDAAQHISRIQEHLEWINFSHLRRVPRAAGPSGLVTELLPRTPPTPSGRDTRRLADCLFHQGRRRRGWSFGSTRALRSGSASQVRARRDLLHAGRRAFPVGELARVGVRVRRTASR